MDTQRFDSLTRAMAAATSRRQLLTVFSSAFAGIGLFGNRHVDAQTCLPPGYVNPSGCVPEACCTGWCFTDTSDCCIPIGQLSGVQCGVDAVHCCSGWCNSELNSCCVYDVGLPCTSHEDCCWYNASPVPGETIHICDADSLTCQPWTAPAADPAPPEISVAAQPIDLATMVSQISSIRSSAHSIVAQIKTTYAPTDPTYIEAQTTYGTVRALFDGWIDGFKIDLVQGTDADEAALRFEQSLEVALQQASYFNAQFAVQVPVTGGGPGAQSPVQTGNVSVTGGGGLALLQPLASLVEVSISVVELFRTAQREAREDILARIEALRWLAWAEIV